ncbi:MAG: hypothetical protein RR338_04260, partial [Clostridia bacterium]
LYTSKPKQYNKTTVLIFGKTNALINMNFEKSYVETKYNYVYDSTIANERDRFVGKTTMKFFGGASVGSLKMKISVLITVTVDTAEVLFPISYLHDIQLYDGEYTIGYKYKMLPGAKLTVGTGATLNLTGDFIIYTGDYVDTATADGNVLAQYPREKGDAELKVEGALNIANTCNFGGLVRGAKEGATVTVNAKSLSMTSKEGGSTGTSLAAKFALSSSITKTGQLRSADGTATDMAQNTTYTYSSTGVWA